MTFGIAMFTELNRSQALRADVLHRISPKSAKNMQITGRN